jgi:hypothetical protein
MLAMMMISWEALHKLKMPLMYIWLILALLMSYSYLRNYQFIRVGNELFPFFGFGWYAVLAFLYIRGRLRMSLYLALAMTVLITFCLWSKFSFVVSFLAMFGALSLYGLLSMNKRALHMLFIMVVSLGAALLLYYIAYKDTYMIGEQAKYYGYLFASKMPLVPDPAYDMSGYNTGSTSSIPKFFYSFLFWYGPVLTLGLVAYAWRMLKGYKRWKYFDALVIIWVVFGFTGTLLVNPRAAYTAPFTAGLLFMVISYLVQEFNNEQLMKISFLSILFAIAEMTLVASADAF